VHALDERGRPKQVCFARTRCGASNVDPGDRTARGEGRGATLSSRFPQDESAVKWLLAVLRVVI
jgi:hypothetical protein